ncbi:DUF6878 family protein [Ruegeria sp. HKCCD8929]|uniref:DUF6878 family protein n=1 Tax=Ruegeria sp. HKCCD8929 TaxID=2683006 RepID=UPI0014895D04|nr:DUF6878 family protein [Ruegeria sp. HKCCD8929]
MDWTTINETMQRMARERKDELAGKRTALLPKLRKLGIEQIEATYDGYGDSGNIEDVILFPEGVRGDAALEANQLEGLEDFLWAVAYNLNPGFEINDGAYGEISWDLRTDRIDVSHSERFTDTRYSEHEDV